MISVSSVVIKSLLLRPVSSVTLSIVITFPPLELLSSVNAVFIVIDSFVVLVLPAESVAVIIKVVSPSGSCASTLSSILQTNPPNPSAVIVAS